jgi:hypothetical protein
MQTRIIGRAHHSVNPSALSLREENKAPGVQPGATVWAVQDSNL